METPKDGFSITHEGQHETDDRIDEAPQDHSGHTTDSEGVRPPLPPRPETIDLLNEGNTFRASPSRANLQSQATTALSLTDIPGQTNADARDGFVAGIGRTLLGRGLRAKASLSQLNSARASEAGDTASVRSFMPNSEEGQEENLFGDFTNDDLQSGLENIEVLGLNEYPQDGIDDEFGEEFEDIGDLAEDGHNEGKQLQLMLPSVFMLTWY
jgi:vacuolar fusion protein MON1